MSQSGPARIAFRALLEDVQRVTPNANGSELVLRANLVLQDSTAMNLEKNGASPSTGHF